MNENDDDDLNSIANTICGDDDEHRIDRAGIIRAWLYVIASWIVAYFFCHPIYHWVLRMFGENAAHSTSWSFVTLGLVACAFFAFSLLVLPIYMIKGFFIVASLNAVKGNMAPTRHNVGTYLLLAFASEREDAKARSVARYSAQEAARATAHAKYEEERRSSWERHY